MVGGFNEYTSSDEVKYPKIGGFENHHFKNVEIDLR
jgi:hypothetical protein